MRIPTHPTSHADYRFDYRAYVLAMPALCRISARRSQYSFGIRNLNIMPWLVWDFWEFLFRAMMVMIFGMLWMLLFLEFGWIEPHDHTAGGPIPDLTCWVVLVWNRHGTMTEEYDNLSFGFDEFRMGWTLVWQCRKQGGWAINWVLASRSTRCNRMSSTEIGIAVLCCGSSCNTYRDIFTS